MLQSAAEMDTRHVTKAMRSALLHPYTSLFSRLALGGVLIFAGITKLPHFSTLIWEIEQYQILPSFLTTAYGYTLPILEIALGMFLILGLFLRTVTAITGLLILSFTVAKINAIARGLDIDVCPCFGPARPLFFAQSLIIDFVMLMLAIQLWLHRRDFLSLGSWLECKRRLSSK